MKLALLAFSVVVVGAHQAAACQPAKDWDKAQINAPVAARAMLTAAHYVDVVSVVSLSQDFEFATRSKSDWLLPGMTREDVEAYAREMKEEFGEGAVKMHLRVIRRLKGDSPEVFTFNGVRRPPEMKKWVAPFRLSQLQTFGRQFDFADWPASFCQDAVYAEVGDRFLVFRDAEGRLLQASVPFFLHGRESGGPAPAMVQIKEESDPWPTEVLRALAGR